MAASSSIVSSSISEAVYVRLMALKSVRWSKCRGSDVDSVVRAASLTNMSSLCLSLLDDSELEGL